MKKISLLLLAILILSGCQTEKPEPKTILGIFTPYFFFQETLKGQVKEVKELNYWAIEQDGKIVAGNPITLADRDTVLNWTNDFIIQLNESGWVEKSMYMDENADVFGYWEVAYQEGEIKSAGWHYQDTLRYYLNSFYQDGKLLKQEAINANADTLLNVMEFEFTEDGKNSVIQRYNYKKEPTTRFAYSYDEEGVLSGYTWSRQDTIRGGMNFTYNQNGFCETQEVYNKMSGVTNMHKYEYKYDETGNWIEYIAYKDDVPEVVCKRTHVYY